MRTRERGVAHVNIFFFLLLLVLFLGALFFAYVQMDRNTELENRMANVDVEKKNVDKQRLIRDQYIESIRPLGEADSFTGKVGFNWDDLGGPPEALQNVPSITKLQELARTFARDAGVPESSTLPISQLLSQTKSALDAKIKEVADLKALRDKLAAEKAAAEQSLAEGVAAAKSTNEKLSQDQADQRAFIDEAVRKADGTIAGLRENINKAREEATTMRDENNKVVEGLHREANLRDAQINSMRQKVALVNPPQAPDGTVISSSQSVGRAWIDLGRTKMLPLGTVFRITSPGKTAVKALGTVIKVEKDRSEIQISDVRDRFDPITSGDLVANELYSPNLRRTVYLLGRFSVPYAKEDVKRILESLGNTVSERLSPQVDLVLVGGDVLNESHDGFTPVEETEEFKKAQSWNIEMSSIHKVRDFLKLGD